MQTTAPVDHAASEPDATLARLIDCLDSTPCRDALAQADAELDERFQAGESVVALVALRATLVDALICHLWRQHAPALAETVCLVAVGGYGRGELHPHSDVDVMVLLDDEPTADGKAELSDFVTSLWDAGLEIGHSVRTVAECNEEAANDLTVATTLMEARLLEGPAELFHAMQAAVGPDRIWPPDRFFEEKRREQIARHHRYDDTAYNLEPNVKGSPGGLRDIQMIGWVAKRYFGVSTLVKQAGLQIIFEFKLLKQANHDIHDIYMT